jgi:hypothetical protein
MKTIAAVAECGTNFTDRRGCPGESPNPQDTRLWLVPIVNTTDNYAHKSRHSIIPFASAEAILRGLGQSKVTFAMFLYAIVCIREGISGKSDLAEVHNSK